MYFISFIHFAKTSTKLKIAQEIVQLVGIKNKDTKNTDSHPQLEWALGYLWCLAK